MVPAQGIARLFEAGAITASEPCAPGQIQPASLDLRLGAEAFRVRASFLPGAVPLAERLAEFTMHRFDLAGGAVLEKGCVYVVPLVEGLALPEGLRAVANAKSST
ncbi:2'-deoxycytidine 5'-triphosphate deaminase, partial [Amaricoccus sp.]|uniref:2'-deoxycytidine 5'-triphosphate deaminase domain-containing protein n=1 Tax=Amaricoccus sp. TaxID=1872485 RepID=UPI00260ECFAD